MDHTITTNRLVLRPLTETDIDFLQVLEARPESYRYERAHAKTPEEVEKECRWYLESETKLPREGAIRWIVSSQGISIGEVHLNCNWEESFEWEIGYMFLAEYWGKGFATEAVRAVVYDSFDNFAIHRIAAFLHAENQRSKALVERIGMQQDGRMRDVRYIDHVFYDEYVYSILKHECKAGDHP